MIASLMDMLFGCWHTKYSFPITSRKGAERRLAAHLTGTYVVCLECGKEFPYDWKQMKVVTSLPKQAPAPALVEQEVPLVSKHAA